MREKRWRRERWGIKKKEGNYPGDRWEERQIKEGEKK